VVFVVAALLLLPVVELAVMIQVGSWIGGWEMLALLVMVTFLGVWIVKQQGLGAWSRIRRDLAEGRVPGPAIVDGALILAAGVLFVIPGFVTDVMAVVLLLPPVRSLCRVALSRRFRVVAALHTASGSVHDGRGGAYDVDSRVRPPSPPPELEA
jgi:UPF0716 protein FxsA